MTSDQGSYDVVLCTLNSEHRLRECLDAVVREIPVHRIILVDGGSTDSTLEIARQYPLVDVHVRPDLNLGEARQFSFERVATEWFVQVDSDVVLKPGWFGLASKWIGKADAIEFGVHEHYVIPIPPPGHAKTDAYQRSRAYLFNVIMRKDAVHGVRLTTHFIDDEWIRRQIERDGRVWLKTGECLADHLSNPVRYGRGGSPVLVMKATPFPDGYYEDLGRMDGATKGNWMDAWREGTRVALSIFRPVVDAWRACKRNPLKVFRAYMRGFRSGLDWHRAQARSVDEVRLQ